VVVATDSVPPYWGVPALSHQFPVLEVVAVTAAVVDVVLMAVDVVEMTVVVVVVVVVKGCVVVDVVVVDELQEAKITDATMRKLANIQIIPLFTYFSFLLEDFWKIIKTLFLIILILLSSLNIFI
jgi:hypothetical protein